VLLQSHNPKMSTGCVQISSVFDFYWTRQRRYVSTENRGPFLHNQADSCASGGGVPRELSRSCDSPAPPSEMSSPSVSGERELWSE
jgi:hypothetical protein